MKKIVVRKPGGPEGLEAVDFAEPLLRENEVLVKIRAVGMNWSEVMIRSGSWPVEIREGFTLGAEGAGIVEKIGGGVEDLKSGDRVIVLDFTAYQIENQGCYAEKIVVSRDRILKYPENLDFAEAAAMPVATLTAFDAMINHTSLPESGTVVVTACTGAVGIAAIQIAKRQGLHVIGTTRSKDKKNFIHSLGAQVAVGQTPEELAKNISAMVGENGVDYIFDPINGETATHLISLLNSNGCYVGYGFLGGDQFQVPSNFLFNQITIRGYVVLRNLEDPQILQAVWNEVLPLIEAKDIVIPVFKTFPLLQAARAHAEMEAGKHTGKLVLTA